MKKVLALLLILVFCLCACGKEEKMYIEKAKLSKAEENIVKLLGAGPGNELIYDFRVDENAKAVQLFTYKMVDGEWKQSSAGGGYTLGEKSGRIALQFDRMCDGLRVAVQTGDGISATEHSSNELLDENLAHASASITDRAQIEYGREIPLAMQIITSKNEIRTFAPEFFFEPERIAAEEYDHVYAITVMFEK